MPKYFFTADTHFSHHNIISYCSRPFESVEQMNQTLIDNWNSVVRKNDFVYHLGDFGFWKRGDLEIIFNKLNGHKHLIKGNHDTSLTYKLDWVWVKETELLKIDKHFIWLSHYPHWSWERSFHGSWHLYGHVHGRGQAHGLSKDVGVDSNNFIPVELQDLKNYFYLIEKECRNKCKKYESSCELCNLGVMLADNNPNYRCKWFKPKE